MTDEIKLFCIVDGDTTAFSVKASTEDTVDDLKEPHQKISKDNITRRIITGRNCYTIPWVMTISSYIILLSGCLLPCISAQAPVPASNMGYATLGEKTLYVHGGVNGPKISNNKLFALDLTQPSWTSSNPPWRAISNGPSLGFESMAISIDQQKLVIWDQVSGISIYSITDSAWPVINFTVPINGGPWYGSRIVSDPNTGLVYIPSTGDGRKIMIVFNTDTNVASTLAMPPASVLAYPISFYSAACSTLRNSILIHGGFFVGAPFGIGDLIEYQPRSSTWSRVNTTGPAPGALYAHCMVPAYNGDKMVIFGGLDFFSNFTQRSIYILDLKDLVWTQGPDADPSHN
ncbi:hypothetical protein BGX26_000995, partial [Mortierella sp. AD094]